LTAGCWHAARESTRVRCVVHMASCRGPRGLTIGLVREPVRNGYPPKPPSQTALRIVITTTLVIGAILVGILVLRETVAPAWLQPGTATTSATTVAEPIAPPRGLPPALPPALPPVVNPTPATNEPTLPPLASAELTMPPAAIEAGAAPSSVASASATSRRSRPPAAPPSQPGVYELPDDFQYSPTGSGNLTFPR